MSQTVNHNTMKKQGLAILKLFINVAFNLKNACVKILSLKTVC